MTTIIVLSVLVSLIGSFAFADRRKQQALQWWFQRQSVKLAAEAEAIRDGLVQESFSMRRTLELLADDENLSVQSQKWLQTLEHFHYSLIELSDRLSLPHVEHSLPLAIKWLIQSWQTSHPELKIEMRLPTESNTFPKTTLVLLMVLDELLRISLTELLAGTSLQISLEQRKNRGELNFCIFFSNEAMLRTYSNLKELKYLSQTFRFLTSGECFWRRRKLMGIWCFRWQIPKIHEDATLKD